MSVRSLNKVMIIGNLTRDPDLRYTAGGTPVVSFGVATNREYTPANGGETVDEVEFHNVVAWSKLAELCDRLLNKGDKVYIEGRLQTSSWEDEQCGKRMYRTEIVASQMIILSSRKHGDQGQEQTGEQTRGETFGVQENETPSGVVEDTVAQDAEDEIPF